VPLIAQFLGRQFGNYRRLMLTVDAIPKQYLLIITWDDIVNHDDGSLTIKNAKMSGPALADAHEIAEEDSIRLDLTEQAYVVIPTPHIMTLSWKGRSYVGNGTINLNNCKLSAVTFGSEKRFDKNDRLLLDLSEHDEKRHYYNFLYRGVIAKANKETYALGGV